MHTLKIIWDWMVVVSCIVAMGSLIVACGYWWGGIHYRDDLAACVAKGDGSVKAYKKCLGEIK